MSARGGGVMTAPCCDHAVQPELLPSQSLRILTAALEGLHGRTTHSILQPDELTAELEALSFFSYIAQGWATREEANARQLHEQIGKGPDKAEEPPQKR